MITITLAGVPRGKGRPQFVRKIGRPITPERTRSYEGALRFAAQEVMGDQIPLLGALAIVVTAYMPIAPSWPKKAQAAALSGAKRPTGKPDADNLMKVIDALNEVVWKDDAQIVDAVIRKFYSDRPRLVIEVRAIDALDFME